MEPLAQFMQRAGLNDEGFAHIVGCSRTRISKLRRGLEKPSLELAAAIERATGGAVRAVDFVRPSAAPVAVAPAPNPNPAAVAAAFDRLGGHAHIAEETGVPVTDLEAMERDGFIWTHRRRALTEFALSLRHELDADKLTLRALGPLPFAGGEAAE